MKRGILYLLIFTCAILYGIGCTSAETPVPQDMQGGETVELNNFVFSHPMTVTSAAEIKEVKRRIKKGVEPQASAYKALITQAEKALDFVPDPPDTMFIMGGYEPGSNLSEQRAWLWRNCSAAYSTALAYTYSGEAKYAEKALSILKVWTDKGTVFTGNDRGLQLGSFFSPMLYAADLLYDYPSWKASGERERFKSWWKNNCLVHTYDVMVNRFNNWKDAGLLGVMSAAVVLEDGELLEETMNQLSGYFAPRPAKRNGDPEPDWKMRKDSIGVYFPHEVVRNDGRSGLTYTAYTLTTLGQCMEIARYAGYNFWTARTQQGASLENAINQYFRRMILKEDFPWNPNPTRYDNQTGVRYNIFEIGLNQCDLIPEVRTWVEANRPVKGAQGDEFTTLNKGNMKD